MLSRLEPEPSPVWNGWGILVCVAAFALGIVAASDNGPTLPQTPELRICADPNNLPFSNRAAQGFENEIAELITRELRVGLSYTWMSSQDDSLHKILEAGRCDVVLSVPSGESPLLTTQPYYRFTQVTPGIAMGVRRNDSALRQALDGALSRRHTEITAILAQYGMKVVAADPELAKRK